MRYPLALALAAGLLALAACDSGGASTAAPSAAASPSAAAPAMTTETACEVVDAAYHELGPGARAQIVKGVTAERNGDTATATKALEALRPLFSANAQALHGASTKVADPELADALDALGTVAARETLFVTFMEFESVAVEAAPAESVLKRKCAEAGRPLKNLE
ncbi:hypothetical protein QEZ54_18395 [Catellatospora sp. KI3]|uniref:hypothetical protein n=1 Tax=Catellatospora sp. KI3 TaxID=3041620 RepID=UPI002482AA25|nr:hypothetical protein [Catellatospora sp. KI3]MDI1462951.1 hypothetical protein [Catellatospora sp. KI3]